MKANHTVVVRAQHDNQTWHVNVSLLDDFVDDPGPVAEYQAHQRISDEPCGGCVVEKAVHAALFGWAEIMS